MTPASRPTPSRSSTWPGPSSGWRAPALRDLWRRVDDSDRGIDAQSVGPVSSFGVTRSDVRGHVALAVPDDDLEVVSPWRESLGRVIAGPGPVHGRAARQNRAARNVRRFAAICDLGNDLRIYTVHAAVIVGCQGSAARTGDASVAALGGAAAEDARCRSRIRKTTPVHRQRGTPAPWVEVRMRTLGPSTDERSQPCFCGHDCCPITVSASCSVNGKLICDLTVRRGPCTTLSSMYLSRHGNRR